MDNYQPVMSRLLILFPCSHMGILGSAAAQKQSWGRIADWLIERD